MNEDEKAAFVRDQHGRSVTAILDMASWWHPARDAADITPAITEMIEDVHPHFLVIAGAIFVRILLERLKVGPEELDSAVFDLREEIGRYGESYGA